MRRVTWRALWLGQLMPAAYVLFRPAPVEPAAWDPPRIGDRDGASKSVR